MGRFFFVRRFCEVLFVLVCCLGVSTTANQYIIDAVVFILVERQVLLLSVVSIILKRVAVVVFYTS